MVLRRRSGFGFLGLELLEHVIAIRLQAVGDAMSDFERSDDGVDIKKKQKQCLNKLMVRNEGS